MRYRDDSSRTKERDHRKPGDSRDATDVRDVRIKKDVRDSRDRGSDGKTKDERHL